MPMPSRYYTEYDTLRGNALHTLNQARSQVFRFGWEKYIFGVKICCFFCYMFKTKFFVTTKFGNAQWRN